MLMMTAWSSASSLACSSTSWRHCSVMLVIEAKYSMHNLSFASLERSVSKALDNCVRKLEPLTSLPVSSTPHAMSCSTMPNEFRSCSSLRRRLIVSTRNTCSSSLSIDSFSSGVFLNISSICVVDTWLASLLWFCARMASTCLWTTTCASWRWRCRSLFHNASASESSTSRPSFPGIVTIFRSLSKTSPSKRSYTSASYVYSCTNVAATSMDRSTIRSWPGTGASVVEGCLASPSSIWICSATDLQRLDCACCMATCAAVTCKQRHTSMSRAATSVTTAGSGEGKSAGIRPGMSKWKPLSWMVAKLTGTSTKDFTRGANCGFSASLANKSAGS
mmetsp:Transcript_120920/g.341997  ORF Transcript_120920/g.341997 Transcript_120920/m.341997 type:complete len:333 (+) Transcript_120920:602-1600(+)